MQRTSVPSKKPSNNDSSTAVNQLHSRGNRSDDIEMNQQANTQPDSTVVASSQALRSAKNEEFDAENDEASLNKDKMKKLCGVPIALRWHPYITFVRTTIEIAILGIVFGLSFQYFSSVTTVSLVPQSECHKCDSCQAQYSLSADHSSVSMPFRYYVKNTTSQDYTSVQDITFYAKWSSCGKLQSGSFTFPSQTTVHKTGNIYFPFVTGNKSMTYADNDDDSTSLLVVGPEHNSEQVEEHNKGRHRLRPQFAVDSTDDDYYYSYGVLTPKNQSAHKNNALSITLSMNVTAGSLASLNYTNSLGLNMSTVPSDSSDMCFKLVCGAVDYFMDKPSMLSSSAVEVLSSSGSPFVQMQAVLVQTSDTVTGTCTAAVYGNPMPFFFASNAVQQSPSYLCTAKSTMAQITSLSFANVLIAFGVMNFAAKASNRISKVGYYHFFTSCGAEVMDI